MRAERGEEDVKFREEVRREEEGKEGQFCFGSDGGTEERKGGEEK